MKIINYIVLLAFLITFGSVGCARQETPVSAFYGTSYELAIQTQLHNPDASTKDGASSGIEGVAAHKAIDRYEKSFDAPPPRTNTYSVIFEGMQKK